MNWIRKNFIWKLAALILAGLLWYYHQSHTAKSRPRETAGASQEGRP